MNTSSSTVPTGMLGIITRVRRRRRLVETAALGLSAGAYLLALIGAAVVLDWRFAWTSPALRWLPPVIAIVIGVLLLVVLTRRLQLRKPLRDEAREIDRTIPALEERWSTVTELSTTKRPEGLKGSPELIAKVVTEASSFEPRVNPETIVSTTSLRWPAILCASAVVIFGVSAFSVAGHLGTLLHRFFAPWEEVTLTRLESASSPQRVVRQGPHDIKASLTGRLPKSATLSIMDKHGAVRTVDLSLKKEVIGATVAHNIPEVDEPFSYQIKAGDALSGWIQVEPVDRPKLRDFALRLEWPAYTKKPVSTWNELPANIRALKGARFEMEFSADQPLTRAELELSQQEKAAPIALEAIGSQRYRFVTELQQVLHFQILAENEFGLRSSGGECRIEVVEDQPPEVKILETSQDVVLNPDETLRIEFEAKDDFGVNAAEIVAVTQKEGEAPKETVIPIDLGKQTGETAMKKSAELDLKQFNLDEKTQISYAVRVRDNRSEAMSSAPPKESDASKTAAANPQPESNSSNPSNPSDPSNPSEPTPSSATPLAEKSTPQTPSSSAPPENPMSKRNLDIACQSCTPQREVRVEKYSGSYDGEARTKKSIAIDAVLQGLRKAAQDALVKTEGAAKDLPEATGLDVPRTEMVRAGLAHTEDGKRLADKLKKESEGTPYAFFALQTDGLVKGGLDPAAAKQRDALDGKPAKQNLDDAAVSLRWVIASLNELTKQYTSLKEVQKAQDLLQQIKEMHLVFLEDMPKMLKAAGASSPYERQMLEVDAAFAKAYEEFLKKRRDVYMQLAELLAKHPELQAKFLEASKTSATLFRDELMRLKGEQDALYNLTKVTENGAKDAEAAAALWQGRIEKLQSDVAGQAAQFAKSAVVWMPADFSPELRASLENGAGEVSKAALRASSPSAGEDELSKAIEQVDHFEDTIAKSGASNSWNAVYARNRFEDIDKLRQSLEQTKQFANFAGEKKFAEALHAAQAIVNTETLSVATKIQQEAVNLIGLGDEVHEAVKHFDDVLKEGVTVPQSQVIESLKTKAFEPAMKSQGVAAAGLERSVEALDDFIQKAIRRMDQANAKRGVSGTPMPPSLEALLASLEEEKRSAMKLGISCQPMNIQVQSDWQQPGSGQAVGAAMQQKRAEEARINAEAAAREAAKAQAHANQRAKEMTQRLETALVAETAPGTAKSGKDKKDNWNTVPSELRASLLQERGQTPPKRYESAIRQYFRSIAETPSERPVQ